MAVASARVRRRGLPAGMRRNPFTEISKLGRGVFASRQRGVGNKELTRRQRFAVSEEEFEGRRFNPAELDDVIEYSELALQRQNSEMMRKSVLFVAGWKDSVKVRKFFENFFEEENPAVRDYGMQLYLDYLKIGGKPLGGNFARIDSRFAELHRRNRR